MKIVRSFFFMGLLASVPAFAATRTVTNLDDSGAGSLRAQIAAAASGDTINFSVTGTIVLSSGGLSLAKNLIVSGPGMDLLTVRINGGTPSNLFSIEGATVTLSGLTCVNATSLAISNAGNLTVNNALITGKSGIFNQGPLRLDNCSFINCTGTDGAAVSFFQTSGPNLFTNCTFDRNSFSRGSIISIWIRESGSPNITTTVRGCTFSRNSGNFVFDNRAESYRDFGTATSSLVLENCTLVDNAAAAIYSHGPGHSKVTLRSCTLANNAHPTASSAGIRCQASENGTSTVTLANTILKHGLTRPNLSIGGTLVSQGYNLCDDDGAGLLTGPGDRINADPGLDPFGLLYHGGYTETIALIDGSPAIDQGKTFGLTSDQRGSTRPMDNPQIPSAAGGDGSDIGAFETGIAARQAGFPSLIVTTADDHDDGFASAGDTTLREAVRTANEIPGPNTITFAPSVTGTAPLLGAIAELVVSDSLTIAGPGARTLAVTGGTGRIFRILDVNVSISGLTLKSGNVGPGSTVGETMQGGAVHNLGTLRFTDCAFTDSVVRGTGSTGLGGSPGGAGQGGAVYNGKFLRLERCTFTRNQALGGNGSAGSRVGGTGGTGGGGQGGAVFNAAQGTLEVINSTFQGNTAQGGRGGQAERGGPGGAATAAIFSAATALITNCTISGNVATGGEGGAGEPDVGRPGAVGFGIGGISATGSAVQLRNTLCAGNSVTTSATLAALDVRGPFSGTFNLIGSADDSTGLTGGSGNQTGTDAAPIDPRLGPLQNSGGQTDIMIPQNGSPAIDRAVRTESIDQIGTYRPLDSPAYPNAPGGDGSDVGAVEVDAPQPGPGFVVTTIADQDDGVASSLACSLREAINASNAQPGPNTITFKAGLTGSITLSLAMMTITDSVTITGPGARTLEVVGQVTNARHLLISGGTNSISGLTFRNGRETGNPQGTADYGGAIYNTAALTVTDCGFVNNAANGTDSTSSNRVGNAAAGGAVANMGTASLTIVRCTFADNAANAGDGEGGFFTAASDGGPARGGAVFSEALASLTVQSCTFHNNAAGGGAAGSGTGGTSGKGGDAFGGAVFCQGSLSVTSSTIHGNRASVGSGGGAVSRGAGISSLGSGGMLRNTICAGNIASGSASDVEGAFASGGYNLIGSASGSTGFTATGDQAGTNAARLEPFLGALANNGGFTDTKLPLAGSPSLANSPALDRGRSFGITHDQRGHLRIGDSLALANASGGDGTDIGAVEYHPLGGVDTDGDGMSDEYENFNGFNPGSMSDGSIDTDGDGVSNAAEFTAATDPRNPGSRLRITAIVSQGDNLGIEFGPAVAGRIYRLQRSRFLGAPWASIGEVFVSFTGSAVFNDVELFYTGSIFDPFNPNRTLLPNGFYRIQAVRPP